MYSYQVRDFVADFSDPHILIHHTESAHAISSYRIEGRYVVLLSRRLGGERGFNDKRSFRRQEKISGFGATSGLTRSLLSGF
jgi:hypothetical protein